MKCNTIACLAGCLATAALLTQCAPSSPGGLTTKHSQVSEHGLLPVIQAPATLQYGGATWRAGYSAASPEKGEALVEYFQPGEGPQNWTRMTALRLLARPTTPDAQVMAMARSSRYPGAAYSLPGGQAGLDTLITQPSGQMEFDIFRYAALKDTPGVKSLQYSENLSVAQWKSIGVPGLKAKTAQQRKLMAAAPLPAISLKAGS